MGHARWMELGGQRPMIFLFPTTKPPSLSLTIQHGRTDLNFHLDPWQTKQRERRGRKGGGGASTARKKKGGGGSRTTTATAFPTTITPSKHQNSYPIFSRNLFILFSSTTTLPLTANRKFFFGREGLGRTDCAAFRPVIPKTSWFFSSFLVLFFCCFDYSPKVVAVARLSCRCPSLQSSPCFLFFSSPSLSLSSPTTQHPLLFLIITSGLFFSLSGSLYIKYAMVIVFFFSPWCGFLLNGFTNED